MNTFAFTRISGNKKTGPMPVTRTDMQSCPPSCGAFAGCYAKSGPSMIHWSKLNKGGLSIDDLAAKIRELPRNTLWRLNESGDLPGIGESIDIDSLIKIVQANKGKMGFTYTHKKQDIPAIVKANKLGFTINVSCDTADEVSKYHALGLPVVAISNNPDKVEYIGGVKSVRCPAEYNDKVQCVSCKLCQNAKRDYAIKFTPHGTMKKRIIPIQAK